MRIQRSWFPAVCLAALLAGPAAALEVKLTVSDDAKVARKAGAVTSGVPFAKGALKDVKKLSVSAGGKVLPAQFTKLAPWDDGSVRWALMDCQVAVPADGTVTLLLRDDGKNRAPAKPVKVVDGASEVRISTGPMVLVIDKKKPGIFKSVKVDGKELVTSAGKGLVLYAPGEAKKVEKTIRYKKVTVTEYGPPKPVVAAAPAEVTVERAGPLRAVVCLRGKFPGVHGERLGYTVRVSAFAGQKFAKVHVWLENGGGMGYYKKSKSKTLGNMEWLLFDGMALEFGLDGEPQASCEGSAPSGKFKVLQVCKLNKDGRKLKYNAYKIYQLKDFEYTVSGGGKQIKKGERTDGVVAISTGDRKLTTAVRNFWQNYEKAIELDGATLKFWLWPIEGQWPRKRHVQWAGLFDKQLETLPQAGLYWLPGGVHKGHEIILDFSGRDAKESWAELSRPLFALAPAAYYAGTEAAPGLFAPPGVKTGDDECNAKLDAWMRMTRSTVDPASATGLVAARKSSPWSAVTYFGDSCYWYGWMDFGDIHVPGRGPVGLHHDWTWIMLVNAMRTGELAFVRNAINMARHRIDVDQLWSDRDPAHVRGLQRGDLGFPAFHCNRLSRPPGVHSNYLAGVALYYMLTGEPKALEACKRNAEGLKVAWAHIAKTRPYAGPQGNMAANAWAMHAYIAMHALTGKKTWLDEALKLFKTNVTAKRKKLGPHLHDRQQIRGQGYTRDDMRYCYAVHVFCLLHHYTGDKDLFKLLKAGCDKDFPENFFDAPLFMADLHAYVALKSGKADYADDAVEHWLEASPESKCPPVFLPGNSQWSRRRAMHMRAGHLLQYYFWKKDKKK